MDLTPDRKLELDRHIARATVDAFETEEPIQIAVCMPPCMAMLDLECPLCEIVTVMPNGTVTRETRGH